MKILVTGGLGYIGSHTVIDLLENNYEIIIADNCCNSSVEVLENIFRIAKKKPLFYQIDLKDKTSVKAMFEKHADIDGIIHFAAYKYVDESVLNPLKYFENNLCSLLNILEGIQTNHIAHFVFSSSCSVYGNIETLPVTENTALAEPQSPYARTKQICEGIIEDFSKINDGNCISLRYFNPVGAHESNELGESPSIASNNLIPRITATAIGKYPAFHIYGTDYPTRDGTCIRDYIHVMDIAHAHTLSLEYLFAKSAKEKHTIFNLGSGVGISVKEMLSAFEKATGVKINTIESGRREGDVIAVYADNTKAFELLHWKASRSIDIIMQTAWNWEVKNTSTKNS